MSSLTQQLIDALQCTYSPDTALRIQSEKVLHELSVSHPHFTSTLFQLINIPQLDVNLRQSAAILFKNIVHKYWDIESMSESEESGEKRRVEINEETRCLIRVNLLNSVVSAPRSIEVQLGQVLYDVIKVDYPDKWTNLISDLLNQIGSQDPARIRGALFCLRTMTKRFEYASTRLEKRTHLHYIVETTFPILLKLFEYLYSQNTMESHHMELLLIKIFWSSTQFGIPPYLLSYDNLQPWMQMLLLHLHRPIPEGEPQDPDEKVIWTPWRIKIWISKIFERYIERFTAPRVHDDNINVAFCDMFKKQYATQLLEVILNLLTTCAAFPRKLTTNLLNYINCCLYYSNTWVMIKPFLHRLTESILLPILYFGQHDEHMFLEDPQEYFRLEFDLSSGYTDPRSAAVSLIVDIVKLRGAHYLQMFIDFFVGIMNRYATTPPHQRNNGEKHAALVVLGNLSYVLMNSDLKNFLEEWLTLHVLPELQSPIPYLRARAIWVFGRYHSIKFQKTENFFAGIQLVINSLNDKILPISIFSALSIQAFLKNKNVRPMIEQIVPQLLESLLNLMNHVNNDDLVGALGTIISKFSDKIQQYIPQITAQLIEHYQRLISKGGELFDDDDQSGFLTAMECMKTLITILENTKTVPGMYPKLEPMFIPILMDVQEHLVDMLPDYIQIVSYFTYHSEISPAMWDVFGKFIEVYFTWGNDFLPDLLAPFDNYISKATDKFLTSPYLEKICIIYKYALEDNRCGENDAVFACQLVEVVLVYCRGKIDGLIPGFLELSMRKLKVATMSHLKVALLVVIANCLYYNPYLTLKFIDTSGATTELFSLWFQLLNTNFKRRHEIKMTILGFSALFHLPFASWPAVLQHQAKVIVVALMKLCEQYGKIPIEKSDSDETGTDSEASDEEDEDIAYGERLPISNEELESIKKEVKEYKKKVYEDTEDVAPDMLSGAIFSRLSELYEDAPSEESDIEEDVISIIDDVDELLFFLEAFRIFSNRDGPVYQQIVQTFTTEEQAALQQLGQEANDRQAKKSANTTTTSTTTNK